MITNLLRQGKTLGSTDYPSINKAKKASREMQKTGVIVRVVPHKTQQAFPIANGGLRPHDKMKREVKK